MTKDELLLLLDELLELEPGTLKGAEGLEDLDGWDSLGIISFMALADEYFGLSLQPRKITGCQTVEDLLGLFDGQIRQEIAV